MRTLKLSTAFAVILWLATQAAFASRYTVKITNATGDGTPRYTLAIKGKGGNALCISSYSPTEDVSITPSESTTVWINTKGNDTDDCGGEPSGKYWPIDIINAKGTIVETGTLHIGYDKEKPSFMNMKHFRDWFLLTCTDAYNCKFTYKNAAPG